MSQRKWRIKDPRYVCPKCDHNFIVGKSRQTGEDCCTMWVECEKCGYDPTGGDSYEQVETVWGWEDELAGYACEIWHDKIASQSKPADAGKGLSNMKHHSDCSFSGYACWRRNCKGKCTSEAPYEQCPYKTAHEANPSQWSKPADAGKEHNGSE